MKYFLFFLGLSLALSSCSSMGGGKAKISGTLEGAEGTSLYVDKYMYGSPIMSLAKIDIDGNGNFEKEFDGQWETGIYKIRVGRNSMYTIIDSTDAAIEINGNVDQFDNYSVDLKGTESGKTLSTWLNNLSTGTWTAKDLQAKLKDDNHPLVEMVAAIESSRSKLNAEAQALYAAASKQVEKDMPNSDFANNMTKMSANLEARLRARELAGRTAVGSVPPPIEQKNPEDKVISLDDLKGKVVLLDFWASWCKPCRRANPMVVDLYKKYNKQGFEVFNVSLDKNKGRWVNAIEEDGLVWDHHVSDLRGWQSIHAQDYGVKSIPRTFLLDRDGKIAGVNIRDKRELAGKIEELL